MKEVFNIGLDAGSTTVKVVAVDEQRNLVHKEYRRHYADIMPAVTGLLQNLESITEEHPVRFCVTGSAGMGLAERFGFHFIQELIASSRVVETKYPSVRTLVDIGGEDAKIIFFHPDRIPDMRMNGNCAGGTGAFIDQMASLLGVRVADLDALAQNAEILYPVASRCGVFAKTDVQNLLSRNVSREDIAASIFHAVSMQFVSSLSRGFDMQPAVMLCGGPLTWIPALRRAFSKVNQLEPEALVLPENAEVVTAQGAAIVASALTRVQPVSAIISTLQRANGEGKTKRNNRLRPLFENEGDDSLRPDAGRRWRLPEITLEEARTHSCSLGIDSGSTTTKMVLLDESGKICFRYYDNNRGNSLRAIASGLEKLHAMVQKSQKKVTLKSSCVTGYGEDLIRNALGLDYGLVETMAHFTAARSIDPDVSFILDIGGQDMKAAFIENQTINRVEINEACSSGCGSFIETFADSLNHTVGSFAGLACQSQAPCDLGTRCTVFMNSRVKQAFREGVSVADISAGLGYSVVKNVLHKVLKLRDTSELGDRIMLQGGTSRNAAVVRALELEAGKKIMTTNAPELMGAYGAALYAKQMPGKNKKGHESLHKLPVVPEYTTKITACKGCENQCTITRFRFENGKHYFAGNKCEKFFSNTGQRMPKGRNLYEEKNTLLFDRNNDVPNPRMTVGIPRVLGMFENYPFWHTLFTHCGIRVILSDPSTMNLYEKGIGSVMSDNICFPAKLVHGHIRNLIKKRVGRIFLPFVVYEHKEDNGVPNSYNCPIVTGYSEVIRSAMNPAEKEGIPFDAPGFSFNDKKLLKKACLEYLRSICPWLSTAEINHSFGLALESLDRFGRTMKERCEETLRKATEEGRIVILLAGRPYHTDPLIQHKTADVITALGADVITEDVVRGEMADTREILSIMQWAYPNRLFKAALWAANASSNVHYAQLTSFGCGPDAFILDEISDILRHRGKTVTVLKVDDISNVGSIRLRIRSLIESLRIEQRRNGRTAIRRFVQTPSFEKKDKHRKVLIPWFSDFYSPFLPAVFEWLGYNIENLPPSDSLSEEYGLKYSNNEICYPATLLVGDLIKALESGKHDRKEIAFGITQTGGQCRATNYIALLKRAMLSAGIDDVPVVSAGVGCKAINEQPGFQIKWRKIMKPVFTGLVYADCLSQMYYATAPRETEKGGAARLKEKYIRLGIRALRERNTTHIYLLAGRASEEFAGIHNGREIPKIGIVGEIFLKYNSYGHKHIVQWLVEQGIEPVIPALSDFFTTLFVNREVQKTGHISNNGLPIFLTRYFKKYVYAIIRKMESRIADFPGFRRIGDPYEEAVRASEIINLNAQFGEGWRISAELAHYGSEGIGQVVSLQPFGCIANHIISKGIEKRVRELYPSMNILFLDFDSGTSEANIYNRLHFMIDHLCESRVMQNPGS